MVSELGYLFDIKFIFTSVCRDVSALHYDPSREEHAAFETKTDKTKERYEL